LRYLILFVLFIGPHILSAQEPVKPAGEGRLTGKVVDSISHVPMVSASVSLVDMATGRTVAGTTTNANGVFRLNGLDDGRYSLLAEFVGHRAKSIADIHVTTSSRSMELRTIELSPSATDLKSITITGRKPSIENKIDRMVFNAERDITSQGGVATDILKKVPQVSVDVDGNVELLGSSAIRFLINGKPSTIFGSNIADVLRSIPASQIKSIEVITNPGAKYDAQGLGGIINIILKQNTVRGINGNMSLTAGTRGENGSYNMNVRKGDFGINAYVNGNLRLNTTQPNHTERLSIDTIYQTDVKLVRDSRSENRNGSWSTGMGFDWTIRKKNSFYGGINLYQYNGNWHGRADQSQNTYDILPPGALLSSWSGRNPFEGSFHSRNKDISFQYKRTFSKKDEELEFGVNHSHADRLNTAASEQYLQPQDSLYYGTVSRNPGTEDHTEWHLDFSDPLSEKVNVGFGAKAVLNDIHSISDVRLYDPYTRVFAPDSLLSNSLRYRQQVYAAYGEISFPLSRQLQAKTGGRLERTNINTYFSNAQQQADNPGYWTFVPSIHLSWKLNDSTSFRLSYSRRIERPGYDQLNPFINTSDPKNISTGNPLLLPETGDRFEVSFNQGFGRSGSFMATLFHRINLNDIQPFIVYHPELTVGDTTYRNVYVTTPQNIGTEKNTGINLYGELNVNDKISVRTNITAFHRHTINMKDPGYNSTSFNYRINLNGSWIIHDGLAAEFFGNFNSARHEAQGKYPSFISYSMAVRKQFWAKKGSLALSLNNPFGEYVRQATELHGANFTSMAVRHIPVRSVSLNFTWRFGKLEFKKEREDRPEPEGGGR